MIEDVLFCLSGVDGEYISVSQGDCRIDGTIGTGRRGTNGVNWGGTNATGLESADGTRLGRY